MSSQIITALCDEVRSWTNHSESFCALDQQIYWTYWTQNNNSFMSCCSFQDRCQDFQWILYYFDLFLLTQSYHLQQHVALEYLKYSTQFILNTFIILLFFFWKLTIFPFIVLKWLAFKNSHFVLYSRCRTVRFGITWR